MRSRMPAHRNSILLSRRGRCAYGGGRWSAGTARSSDSRGETAAHRGAGPPPPRARDRRSSHELRASAPASRWETFERCYDRLYSELPWLVGTGGVANPGAVEPASSAPPGRAVYEVGSGAGELAVGLAEAGYRGHRHRRLARARGSGSSVPTSTWAATDGVHLDQFAAPCSFDAVISNQLIEHLHPDDLESHLRSALARCWRRADATRSPLPHALTGPHDVSKVLELDAPGGMHLREYRNIEMVRALRRAGFHRARSVLYSPRLVPAARSRAACTSGAMVARRGGRWHACGNAYGASRSARLRLTSGPTCRLRRRSTSPSAADLGGLPHFLPRTARGRNGARSATPAAARIPAQNPCTPAGPRQSATAFRSLKAYRRSRPPGVDLARKAL